MTGGWGEYLCIVLICHVLRRPIHIFQGTILDQDSFTLVSPPEFVAEEAWGELICLVSYQDIHFEGTESIAIIGPVGVIEQVGPELSVVLASDVDGGQGADGRGRGRDRGRGRGCSRGHGV